MNTPRKKVKFITVRKKELLMPPLKGKIHSGGDKDTSFCFPKVKNVLLYFLESTFDIATIMTEN